MSHDGFNPEQLKNLAEAAELFHDMEARARLNKKYGAAEPELSVAIATCRKHGYTVSKHKRTTDKQEGE